MKKYELVLNRPLVSPETQKEIEELNKLREAALSKIIDLKSKAQEILIKELVEIILNRPFREKDAKRITLLFMQGENNYRFAFDGIVLGLIVRNEDSIEFQPFDEWTKIKEL